MKKRFLLLMLFVALLAPWAVKGQTLSEYTVTTSSETYTSIADANLLLSGVYGDGNYQEIDLPFEFKFGETTYAAGSKIIVRSDGYLYFPGSTSGHYAYNAWSNNGWKAIIPFLNTDGDLPSNGATSGAYATTQTDANGQMLVVEFKGLKKYNTSTSYNFQVRLHANGNISAIYETSTISGNYHNFILTNLSDKICLQGSYAEPEAMTSGTLPQFSVAPAAGQVITFVRPVISCPKPTNLSYTLTPGQGNTATFNWDENGEATSWQLCLNGDEENLIPVNSKPFTYNEFTPEMAYTAKIRAYCDDVDQSDWSNTVSFTPTDAYSVTLNNDTQTNANIPIYYSLVGSSYYWDDMSSQFIIPADDITSLQWGTIDKLTFYNNTSSVSYGSAQFVVYVGEVNVTTQSACTDWNSLTNVYTGALSVINKEMEITFTEPFPYTGKNLLIGLKVSQQGTAPSSNSWYGKNASSGASVYTTYSSTANTAAFLPKVTINYTPGEAPDCLPVSNLSYDNVQVNSVELNWTASASGETAWKLQYKKTSDADWTTYPTAITEKPFPLGELTENTTYQWQVAAWCDTENPNGISDYVAGENFTTKQNPVVVGDSWGDNFEGESCGWAFYNSGQTNQWVLGSATNNGGTHSMYVSNDNGTTNAYSNTLSVVYARKLLTFADGKYEFSFNWKANGESNYDYIRAWLAPSTVEFTAGQLPNGGTTSSDFKDYISSTETGWIPLDGTVETGGKLNLQTDWQSKSLAQNVTEGNWYLVFMWCNDGSTNENPPAAIDNVSINRVACPYDVTGLEVAETPAPTAHEATINWNDSEATQWQIAWSKDSNFATAETDIVNVPTKELTELDAISTYYVKVRAYCGGDDYGTWSSTIDFETECEAISTFPWNYNFNSDATGNFSKQCWYNNIVSGSYKFKVTNSSNGSNTTNQLYMPYNSGSVAKLVLPELEIPSDKTYQFMIDVWRTTYITSYNDGIGVYVNTTRDLEGATQLGFLYRVCTKTDGGIVTSETSNGWYTYTFNIPYNENCFIILRGVGDGGNSTYVDNFVIRQAPDCPTPTGLALTPNSQTPEGATITWDNVEATSWIVEYKKSTEDDYTALAEPVTSPTHTFTGLDAETTYNVRIKVNCDGVTYPTNPISFTTQHTCPAPKNLVVNSVSDSQAVLSWTPGYNETEWTVKYKKHTDSEYTTAEPNPVTTTPSITLNELVGGTTYDVQIYGCDSEHVYTVSNAFTTAYSTPFAESFNTGSKPASWNNYVGLLTDDVLNGNTPLSSGTGQWSYNVTRVFGTYHAVDNIYGSTSCRDWLVTPNIVVGSGMSLSFDLALTDYGSTDPIEFPEGQADDKFVVLISIDNAHTWTILRQWDNAGSEYVYNEIAPAGESVYIDLASYSGQSVRIAFYGESTVSVSGEDNDMHIDNVEINTTPACFRPASLKASDVTNHSATLTWLPGSDDQTAWEFKYNIGEDFDPAEAGTLVENITANPYTFDKTLYAESTYYFYVRGNCGEPSAWNRIPCSFTTEANAPAPTTFANTEVGPDWVDLYWNAPSGDLLSGYGIYYSTESATPATTAEALVTINDPTAPTADDPYRLPGLDNETTYYIWVRANHETDVYSDWTALSGSYITTLAACPAPTDILVSNITQNTADLTWTGYSDSYDVVYRVLTPGEPTQTSEDFSTYTATTYSAAGYLPEDWKGYSSGSYKPHVSNNSELGPSWDLEGFAGGAGSDNNFLYMIGNNTYPYASYTILPQISDLEAFSFDYGFEDASYGTLTVGYCTDNTSGSTFTPFDDLTITGSTTSVTVSLTEADIAMLNSNNGYLTFKWYYSYAYGVGIDNVIITTTAYTAGEWSDPEETDTESITINGLTAGTNYEVKAQGTCGSAPSEWSNIYSFKTLATGTKVFNNAYSDGLWSNADNWVPSGVPTITDNVIIRANATIGSTCEAEANSITYEGSPAPTLTIADGGQLKHAENVNATLQKEITAWTTKDVGGWYFIASPVHNFSTETLISNGTGHYDLFAYDEPNAYWRSNTGTGAPFTKLERGKGYLYANKDDVTLNFAGMMVRTDEPFSLPLSYACTYDDVKGFNLVGNPYTCNIMSGNMLIGSTPVLPIYVINDEGRTKLTAVTTDTYAIKPGEGFFVQATATNQTLTINPTAKDNFEFRYIKIVAGNENGYDNTFIQLEQGNTLRKMDIAETTSVYVINDGDDYAAARVEELAGTMPVHFKAVEDGEFTITINAKNIEASTMMLFDNQTGELIDLLETPTYAFKASAEDDDNRFKLIFDFNNNYNGVDDNYVNGNFAYQNGDELFVSGDGTLQVFDVMGRFVMSKEIHGSESVSVSAFETGVYMLRFVGENIMTQKIVVR